MKNKLTVLFLFTMGLIKAQVIIGDETGTADSTEKTSVLLEFADTGNKGIILPYVSTLPTEFGGTIILDATDETAARVKYYDDVNAEWIDLSGIDGDITDELTDTPQPNIIETGKSIIGADESDADGVLVLESKTKALLLPRVASTDDIPDPSAGMIVYINITGSKRLAVFNGSTWSYWQPNE